MVTVTFVASLQDFQEARTHEMADRLRADHPEWKVELLPPKDSGPVLAKYKLQFGPAILVDDRVEFVGIPRYRMLVERVAMVAARKVSPRTAQPPPTPAAAPSTKPATPPPSPAPRLP